MLLPDCVKRWNGHERTSIAPLLPSAAVDALAVIAYVAALPASCILGCGPEPHYGAVSYHIVVGAAHITGVARRGQPGSC